MVRCPRLACWGVHSQVPAIVGHGGRVVRRVPEFPIAGEMSPPPIRRQQQRPPDRDNGRRPHPSQSHGNLAAVAVLGVMLVRRRATVVAKDGAQGGLCCPKVCP